MVVLAVWIWSLATMPYSSALFQKSVQPILLQRCVPCHFAGGKMYQRLPFDRPQTILKLGEKKIFTRIRDEREQAAIRAFLQNQR